MIRGIKTMLIPAALCLVIAVLFRLIYWLPYRDTFLWYTGVFVCFYIPGSLVLRYLNENRDECFVHIFHSLALGIAFMPLIYAAFRRLSHPEIIYVFLAIVFLAWITITIREFKDHDSRMFSTYPDILSVSVFILAILFLLHLSYFTDVVFLGNAFKVRNVDLTETFFHLGIINVLRETFPPFYPYASGVGLSHYHMNMHLEIELLHRLFLIDNLKLSFYYFPFLYFSLLTFLPFLFVRNCSGTRSLGVITGILVFGSDLSFIPGLFGKFQPGFVWNSLMHPTVWPVLTLNGNLPALSVMFLSFLHLKKYYDGGKTPHVIIFALLGFCAYGFKSSMGPHLMGASLLTGAISLFFHTDSRGARLCFISAVTMVIMGIDAFFLRGTTGNYIMNIEFFNQLRDALGNLGLNEVPWFLYLIVFPVYIIAAFGVRAVGFFFLRNIFQKRILDPAVVFLLIFAVSGFLLSEMTFIGRLRPPPYKLNNAMWFAFQSLMAAWLFIPLFFLRMRFSGKTLAGVIILTIILSLPGTVQFLWLRSKPAYHTVSSDANEIVRYLETTPQQSVVLHLLEDKPSLASTLSGRPSVLEIFQTYAIQNIGVAETTKRLKDIGLFFRARAGSRDRSSILKRYGVDYVYAPVAFSARLDDEPLLSQVLSNSEYVLYKVSVNVKSSPGE